MIGYSSYPRPSRNHCHKLQYCRIIHFWEIIEEILGSFLYTCQCNSVLLGVIANVPMHILVFPSRKQRPRPIQPLQYKPTAVSVLLNIFHGRNVVFKKILMKLRFSFEPFSFHIWSFAVSCKIIRDFVRNFIENKAFLPWNIFNKTGTAVGLYFKG